MDKLGIRSILTNHPKQSSEILDYETITTSLCNLGLPCICDDSILGLKMITYYITLDNKKDISKLKKLTQAIIITLGHELTLTVIADPYHDFTITMYLDNNNIAYFDYYNPNTFCINNNPCACLGALSSNNDQRTYWNPNTNPHLLIAGATGSGKSVCLNTIICSLMANISRTSKIEFYFIDPKRVELSMYEKMCTTKKIVYDVDKALLLLNDMVDLIQKRYKYLQDSKIKDIKQCSNMSHVFIVIDELADLMLVSKYECESYLVRIAQLGRACGVHLIIATQRPSVNVITGLIKANILTRIALQSASVHDSLTIIDHKGAEQLHGAGDAIYYYGRNNEKHFQVSYISNKDIQSIVDYFTL